MFATRNPYTSCSIHFTKLMNNTLVSPGVENLLNRIPKIPRSISLTSTLSLPSTFWKDEKKCLDRESRYALHTFLTLKKTRVQRTTFVCRLYDFKLLSGRCGLLSCLYNISSRSYEIFRYNDSVSRTHDLITYERLRYIYCNWQR